MWIKPTWPNYLESDKTVKLVPNRSNSNQLGQIRTNLGIVEKSVKLGQIVKFGLKLKNVKILEINMYNLYILQQIEFLYNLPYMIAFRLGRLLATSNRLNKYQIARSAIFFY